MGGFSNKETDYNSDSLNISDNNTSFIDSTDTNLKSNDSIETVDFDDFSKINDNDPYSISDTGFTLEEIKDEMVDLDLSNGEMYVDTEIL